MASPYRIKLPVFEGPFDLLLFLIRKNEVDIYDIPIAEITHQYLEYLELMKILDLDIAGEFIEMVATLILIKVRMLLPGSVMEGEEEFEDPRAQLVAQLIEYQRFKQAAAKLSELESERRKYFPRAAVFLNNEKSSENNQIWLREVSLFDLLTAFKAALDNMPKVTVHQVNIIKVTLENQVKFIFEKMSGKPYVFFREMVASLQTKMELIVTFMAILDLIRLRFITAKQTEVFGEIRLVPLQNLSISAYLETRDKELLNESVNG